MSRNRRNKLQGRPIVPGRSRPAIAETRTRKTLNGGVELVLQSVTSLPSVSVVTITKDRADMFALAIHNWKSFRYPRNSIEWLIIDDSPTDELGEILRTALPDDNRVRYIWLSEPLQIADKRNYAMERTQGEIAVMMDDDDYHFPDRILVKARVLHDNPDKDCVCSLPVATYDLVTEQSTIADRAGNDIPEASLAFRKSFWETGKFANGPNGVDSEWYGLCNGRWSKMISIPTMFNLVMLTHSENATGALRRTRGARRKVDRGAIHKIWGSEVASIVRRLRVIRILRSTT